MRSKHPFPFALLASIAIMAHAPEAAAQSGFSIRELSSGTPSSENRQMSPDKETFLKLFKEQGASGLRNENVTGYKYPETYVTAVLASAYFVDMSRQADRDCANNLVDSMASRIQLYYTENYDSGEFIARQIQQAKEGACRNSPAAFEGAMAMLDDITALYEAPIQAKRQAEEAARQAAEAVREQALTKALEDLAAGVPDNGEPLVVRAQNGYIERLRKNTLSIHSLSGESVPLGLIDDLDGLVDRMQNIDPDCRKAAVQSRAVPSAIRATWDYLVSPGSSAQPSGQSLNALSKRCSEEEIAQFQTFVSRARTAMDEALPVARNRLAEEQKQRDAEALAEGIAHEKRVAEEQHRKEQEEEERRARKLAAQQEKERAYKEHLEQLRSGTKPIISYQDAIDFHGSEDGARDVVNPAVNPSGKLIHLQIKLERVDGKIYIGSYGDYPVYVRTSGKTQIVNEQELRIGRAMEMVGRYSENANSLFGKNIPVIDALFIEGF